MTAESDLVRSGIAGLDPILAAGIPRGNIILLEGAIGTPIESGRIYGLLAEIYESNGRPDDAHRVRQQGQRKFPKDKGLMLPPER